MKYYFYRYFWWLGFPLFWWRNWRYDSTKEIPFKPNETNYILGYNEEPELFLTMYYKSEYPPTNFIVMVNNNEPMDRIWCAKTPPKRPARPMPKGTITYA